MNSASDITVSIVQDSVIHNYVHFFYETASEHDSTVACARCRFGRAALINVKTNSSKGDQQMKLGMKLKQFCYEISSTPTSTTSSQISM